MAIPDFQTLMLPVLRAVADGSEHRSKDVTEQLADQFDLSPEDRQQLLRNGIHTFSNRVAWAKSHLVLAGLLEPTKGAQFKITDRGRTVLTGNPERIDINFLKQFSEYTDFRNRGKSSNGSGAIQAPEDHQIPAQTQTPDELIRATTRQIETALAKELLERIVAASPAFFEALIVKLLLAMGYGGSRSDAGQRIGKSGDHGIDGVIDQDALGLDRVYVQAKKYSRENPVSEPEIRGFSGSLGAAKATKGVFVTTSSFTLPARDFAERHPSKIVLIDGERLTDLMIRYNVGARVEETLYIKRVDEDFFLDE